MELATKERFHLKNRQPMFLELFYPKLMADQQITDFVKVQIILPSK